MEYLLIGFFTGLSLILALGAQNVFVIEQGLKRQYTFLVCLICSISDYLLIFLGIILFEYFQSYFNQTIELILNITPFFELLFFSAPHNGAKNFKTLNAPFKLISICFSKSFTF